MLQYKLHMLQYQKLACRFFAMLLALTTCGVSAGAPYIAPDEDAKHLTSLGNIRLWTPEQQVAAFRNFDLIADTRTIAAGDSPLQLTEARRDLGPVLIHHDSGSLTVDEYFKRQSVAGLLVIRDGQVVYERYGLGNSRNTRWVSFSVAKSVVSMLVGAAIKDGYIAGVEETVTDYLPRLKGSPYEQTTIRHLLQMSSGVLWNEDYADLKSDINRIPWSALGLTAYVKSLERAHPPGTNFNYNTAETRIIGNLLRAAIGNNLSFYLTEKIWQPFGMESDANWILTGGGGESGGCCISATLRDYGRLGLFALGDGKLPDGSRVLPEGWMSASTTPSQAFEGYGYFWWLIADGVYQASGIHGQGIRIDTRQNVVIALHSARAVASDTEAWALQDALYASLTEAVADQGSDSPADGH